MRALSPRAVYLLLALAANVNGGKQDGYSGRYFKLNADIDLKGVTWTPIGNLSDSEKQSTFFRGTIDGAVTPGTILGRTNADSSYDAATKANAKVLVDGKSSGAEVGTTGRMYESADEGGE